MMNIFMLYWNLNGQLKTKTFMKKLRSKKDIKLKIAELEERCKVHEKTIAKDKAEWNVLNHEIIYEKIRVLMAQILSLQWAIGEENNF